MKVYISQLSVAVAREFGEETTENVHGKWYKMQAAAAGGCDWFILK